MKLSRRIVLLLALVGWSIGIKAPVEGEDPILDTSTTQRPVDDVQDGTKDPLSSQPRRTGMFTRLRNTVLNRTSPGSTGSKQTPTTTIPTLDTSVTTISTEQLKQRANADASVVGNRSTLVTRPSVAQPNDATVIVQQHIANLTDLIQKSSLTGSETLLVVKQQVAKLMELATQPTISARALKKYATTISTFLATVSVDALSVETLEASEKQLQTMNTLLDSSSFTALKSSVSSTLASVRTALEAIKAQKTELATLKHEFSGMNYSPDSVESQFFVKIIDPLEENSCTVADLKNGLSMAHESLTAFKNIKKVSDSFTSLFDGQSEAIQLDVDENLTLELATLELNLKQSLGTQVEMGAVDAFVIKAQALQTLLVTYQNAGDAVSALDAQVKDLQLSASEQSLYEQVKLSAIQGLRNNPLSLQVLTDVVNLIKVERSVTTLQKSMGKSVNPTNAVQELGSSFKEVNKTFVKQLDTSLTNLKEQESALVKEKDALLTKPSTVTTVTTQAPSVTENRSPKLTKLAAWCRALRLHRLANWVQSKVQSVTIPGEVKQVSFDQFKQELGLKAGQVEVLTKTLDLEKVQKLYARIAAAKQLNFNDQDQIQSTLSSLEADRVQLKSFLDDLTLAHNLFVTKQVTTITKDDSVTTVQELIDQVTQVLKTVIGAAHDLAIIPQVQAELVQHVTAHFSDVQNFIQQQSAFLQDVSIEGMRNFDGSAVQKQITQLQKSISSLETDGLSTTNQEEVDAKAKAIRSSLKELNTKVQQYIALKADFIEFDNAFAYVKKVQTVLNTSQDYFDEYSIDMDSYNADLNTLKAFSKMKNSETSDNFEEAFKERLIKINALIKSSDLVLARAQAERRTTEQKIDDIQKGLDSMVGMIRTAFEKEAIEDSKASLTELVTQAKPSQLNAILKQLNGNQTYQMLDLAMLKKVLTNLKPVGVEYQEKVIKCLALLAKMTLFKQAVSQKLAQG